MLQQIRDKSQGWFAGIIITLIIASFVLWGAGDYLHSSTHLSPAAKVDGVTISWGQVGAFSERIRRQFGRALSETEVRRFALEGLVQAEQIEQFTQQLGFDVGEEQMAQAMRSIPVFQVEGVFSKERYREVLQSAGLNEASFRKEIHQDILARQLEWGIVETDFLLPFELDQALNFWDQERSGQYVAISTAPIQRTINIEQADIEAYFKEHPQEFTTPEKVKLEYIVLSTDLVTPIAPDEAMIVQYYEQNQEQFKTPVRLHVAHILFENTPAGKKQAEELRVQILAGEDFAKAARAYSQDTLSKNKGGDLGWVSPGDLDPAFEKGAYALEHTGDISPVVTTSFGLHLIQLLAKEDGRQKTLAEVKGDIIQQLTLQQTEEQFAQLLEKAAQLAFESQEGLIELARTFKTPVLQTDYIDEEGNGLAKNLLRPALLEAAFSEEVLQARMNSEVIELDPKQAVILRVVDHQPEKLQSLAENRAKIVALLQQEKASQEAQNRAELFKQKILAGATMRALAKEFKLQLKPFTKITRDANQNIPPEVLDTIFAQANPNFAPTKPVVGIGVNKDGTRYVVQIKEAHSAHKIAVEEKELFEKSLARTIGKAERQAIAKVMEAEVPVKFYPDPVQKLEQPSL